MKILTVVGARPQFIKAAMVSQALREKAIDEVLVHTGQHYDENMSQIFFEDLELPEPDFHLGIGGGSHGQNTGRMIEALEAVMLRERPDWVLVYGDTDSTLAGALAAVKLHIPVAHVKAGLRSFNRRMLEEINRVLTDHAADLLFFANPEGGTESLSRRYTGRSSVLGWGCHVRCGPLLRGESGTEKLRPGPIQFGGKKLYSGYDSSS